MIALPTDALTIDGATKINDAAEAMFRERAPGPSGMTTAIPILLLGPLAIGQHKGPSESLEPVRAVRTSPSYGRNWERYHDLVCLAGGDNPVAIHITVDDQAARSVGATLAARR
jgi:hypothetical protein